MVDRSRSDVPLPYRETVRASWLLVGLLLIAGFVALAGGVAVAFDANATTAERIGVPLLMIVIASTLVFIGIAFLRLRIEVDSVRLRWSFGPLGKTVPMTQIAAVGPEPYRWLRFGGWGIRYGLFGGVGRAYTVPFSLRGAAVELRDGTRYYLSSNDPDRLTAAIEAAQVSGGTRR
jgi:hypothetical protein